MTEQTWPENAWPTAEQFADWYVLQSRDERVRLAEDMLRDAQDAARCFRRNHEGWRRELELLRAQQQPKPTARPPHPDTMAGK